MWKWLLSPLCVVWWSPVPEGCHEGSCVVMLSGPRNQRANSYAFRCFSSIKNFRDYFFPAIPQAPRHVFHLSVLVGIHNMAPKFGFWTTRKKNQWRISMQVTSAIASPSHHTSQPRKAESVLWFLVWILSFVDCLHFRRSLAFHHFLMKAQPTPSKQPCLVCWATLKGLLMMDFKQAPNKITDLNSLSVQDVKRNRAREGIKCPNASRIAAPTKDSCGRSRQIETYTHTHTLSHTHTQRT